MGLQTRAMRAIAERAGRAGRQWAPRCQRALCTKRTTHFGNAEVPWEEKEKLVGQVFSSVASKYDVMNDVMSAGVHRWWKDELIKELNPTPYMTLLDVAGGTGDIGFRFLDTLSRWVGSANRAKSGLDVERGGRLIVSDINADMLEVGREKFTAAYGDPEANGISFMVGDAMDLHQVPDNSIDAYTISFGLRNVTDQSAYQQYSDMVIPEMGGLVAGDKESYRYLVESIRKMPDQDQLAAMMRGAGFDQVIYRNLTFGVVAIHSGFKELPVTDAA